MSDVLTETIAETTEQAPWNPWSLEPPRPPKPQPAWKLFDCKVFPGVRDGFTSVELIIHVSADVARPLFDAAAAAENALRAVVEEQLRQTEDFQALESARQRLADIDNTIASLQGVLNDTDAKLKSPSFKLEELDGLTEAADAAQGKLGQLSKARSAVEGVIAKHVAAVHRLVTGIAESARSEALQEVREVEKSNALVEVCKDALSERITTASRRGTLANVLWSKAVGEMLATQLVGSALPVPFKVDAPDPLVGIVAPFDPAVKAAREAAARVLEDTTPVLPERTPTGYVEINIAQLKRDAVKPPKGVDAAAWAAAEPKE